MRVNPGVFRSRAVGCDEAAARGSDVFITITFILYYIIVIEKRSFAVERLPVKERSLVEEPSLVKERSLAKEISS
jgi:hypothetical protein